MLLLSSQKESWGMESVKGVALFVWYTTFKGDFAVTKSLYINVW
jgi:hypothetical protein